MATVSEQLRQAIERCGQTRYRISMETGIDQAALSRFVNDPDTGLTLASVDKLCSYLGLELVQLRKRKKGKA
jgi:DNA-binding Xre family transcriptional regulator